MARPTNMTDEVIEKAKAYVDGYQKYGHAVPSVVGLCKAIDRARSTVYDWASQELVTFNQALLGEYNASIAKLLLGKHGYSDKQEVGGMDGKAIELVSKIERVIIDG
mgnify:CR=1 FL=1